MKENQITVGSDPEIFVEHKDGTTFPAFEFLPEKTEPLKTLEGNDCYLDGVQCEFSVVPSTFIPDVVESIKNGLKGILNEAHKKDRSAHLSTKTVVDTPIEWLQTLPYHWVEWGCMPSFSAYGLQGIEAPGESVPVRFAGGHIHLGIGKQKSEMINSIVRALDVLLAVPCVILFESLDNPIRRRYYGGPGNFRVPPHGLEYRTLSCAWLYHPKLAAVILDLARKITAYTLNGKKDWIAEQEEITETILLCDVDKARAIVKRNQHIFKQMKFSTDLNPLRPIEESLPTITNIEQNWNL